MNEIKELGDLASNKIECLFNAQVAEEMYLRRIVASKVDLKEEIIELKVLIDGKDFTSV